MTLARRARAAVLTAALTGGVATAQAPVVPCPPTPCPPGMAPTVPYTPGQPGQTPGPATPPAAPGTPDTPSTPTPPAATPPAPAAPPGGALAQATERGGAGDFTSKPGVFGDLFGGAGIPAYIANPRAADGRPLLPPVRLIPVGGNRALPGNVAGGNLFVVPTGSAGPNAGAADELLFARNPVAPAGTPAARTTLDGVPDGFVVDPRDRGRLTLVPTVNRGAFKITENETPRPTTRAYLTYNYYDNLLKGYGSPFTPRIQLHQETFGYEQAFNNQQWSVGLRLPYNQLVGPGINSTNLGDLTVIAKRVIAENRCTGDLLTAGLSITTPTGDDPPRNVLTNEVIHATLIQPFLGYILTSGDWFLQGFSSVVVPTDSSDVTFYSQSLALGYTLFQRPGDRLSAIYPVFEAHLNTPLNHRNFRTDSVGFADSLTLLGGTFFEFYSRSTLGFAAGAPVTGPRPFSLQATCQLSIRF